MNTLARQWQASRNTVRKALRTLENDGLIKRYPAYGYRVLPPAATATERTHPVTARHQGAATDSEKAVARELAALLKPALDHINGQLDTILEQITALKKATTAPHAPDRR